MFEDEKLKAETSDFKLFLPLSICTKEKLLTENKKLRTIVQSLVRYKII